MPDIDSGSPVMRFMVLAPTRKDGTLTCSVLERAGIACRLFPTLDRACDELDAGAAGLLLAEEKLGGVGGDRLVRWLSNQPPWSDLPVLLLARAGADSAVIAEATELLGNITVLERPTRIASLVTAAKTALRARLQQYRVRDHLNERARASRIESLLAAVVASSDDAIISKTLEGNILTWNAGAERLFGYTASETIGKSILLLIPPERHAEEADLLRRLRLGERIEHYETIRVTKDGRRRDVSLTLSPVIGENGRIIAASKVARDITQQKQAEAALHDADRRKDEFLAVLAHELRNPLAPIRNSLHILRLTGQLDAASERLTDIMDRQVTHMVRLVDDLLEISRITRGMIELRKEQLDIAGIIRGAVETSRPLIETGRHELALELPTEPLMIEGDSVRLAQVFANLLNNAAKYTDRGGRIRVSATSDGDDIVVSVRDNGVGIPSDKLTRVFDLFVQADRNTEGGRGGLGIGLTLAKWLVEMHGGTIRAFSDGLGRGSEFVVRLPRSAVQPARARPMADQPIAAPSPHRVLVVDDNVDAAESMGVLLRLMHVDTQVVHNGADALDAMGNYQPSVILLDIGMPDMDGHEVARRIRQRPDGQSVTLIALTGWGQEQDRQRTLAAGFDFHLTKPADINALRALLTSVEPQPS